MSTNNNPDMRDRLAGTASRSGFDSASEKARGQVKEAEGTFTSDEHLKEEGETQQFLADAEEKEALKPWRREHHQS
jgi:uncharacterized protein YjbJ (UPF0337 family)